MDTFTFLSRWESDLSRTRYFYQDKKATIPVFRPVCSTADLAAQQENGRWYIELNSYGLMPFVTGVLQKDAQKAAYGLRIFEFALSQQLPDGSFPEKSDLHHSSAFFFETLGRLLILARQAPFSQYISSETLAFFEQGLRRGVAWFAPNPEFQADCDMNHRFFLNAAVVLGAQKALPEGSVSHASLQCAYDWLEQGIRNQWENGVSPEHNGFDTNYQSLAITFALTSLMTDMLPPALSLKTTSFVENAVRWLEGRIRPDGTINSDGNTRMGMDSTELERTNGKCKRPKVYEHAFALVGAGLYFNSEQLMQKAAAVMEHCPWEGE